MAGTDGSPTQGGEDRIAQAFVRMIKQACGLTGAEDFGVSSNIPEQPITTLRPMRPPIPGPKVLAPSGIVWSMPGNMASAPGCGIRRTDGLKA